jgi:hypothetical protein
MHIDIDIACTYTHRHTILMLSIGSLPALIREERVSAHVDGGEHARGPLFRYEQKVASGDFMAGDQNQVVSSDGER